MSEQSFAERISDLRKELGSYSRDIGAHLQAIRAPHAETHAATDLTHSPLNAVQMLHADVLELVREARGRRDGLGAELRECEALAGVLRKVADAVYAIEVAARDTTGSDIPKASESLQQLQARMTALSSAAAACSEWSSSPVVTLLKRESRAIALLFRARVKRLARLCVHVSQGKVGVQRSLQGVVRGEPFLIDAPIRLVDLWTALLGDGGARELVEELVRAVWLQVLHPLSRERKAAAPKVFADELVASLTFEAVARAAPAPPKPEGASTYHILPCPTLPYSS